MHPTAGPSAYPHTRPRPVHWLATAAALAAVVTGAALAGPGDATATTPTTHAAAPDPQTAHYPLDCHGAGPQVTDRAQADLDGDGRPETAVAVRCASGGGTPPSGVYVLASPHPDGTAPRIRATLVDPRQRMTVTGLTAAKDTVSATVSGYSGPGVPRCCPDLRTAVKWRWTGGKFTVTTPPVARSA
ncbi:hypothetical protein BLA24_29645 [Streptomyces cinnamoneus]|uniref:Secreted protein n=1 Tax=Streptomyces cinnamoneus TaxID=53446 RepID=A0A2G1XBE7_STRCJ|nr:hypothetical protein [Streptomyces cinnamoneus]PHQ48521.1 hypothetical protein BLA24_29645 [Streptomyces cinnamoneus]PPT12480.1 hypothetical protein CYQ11_05830 [Streptomyces cinnamoneus]